MKYLAIAIIWCALTLYLIIERLVKVIIIWIQFLWFLKIELEWFDTLKTYFVFVPFLFCAFEVDNLKDYYSFQNWQIFDGDDYDEWDNE
jgi:hypothetical protein